MSSIWRNEKKYGASFVYATQCAENQALEFSYSSAFSIDVLYPDPSSGEKRSLWKGIVVVSPSNHITYPDARAFDHPALSAIASWRPHVECGVRAQVFVFGVTNPTFKYESPFVPDNGVHVMSVPGSTPSFPRGQYIVSVQRFRTHELGSGSKIDVSSEELVPVITMNNQEAM